jgi:glutamyl endopeptidase
VRRASFLAALMLGLPFSVSTGGNLPTHGALPAYPHDSVSSDGLYYSAPERSITASGTRAYRGTADRLANGEAADGLAEYRQEIESAEEVWSLLMRKPAKSGYGSETIIGLDSRTRVNPTTSFPARATALITFNQGSGSFICTGWLINKNTVATAGHCVHTGGPNGSFSRNVRVYPGRNGSQAPFGSCTARTLFTVVGWANASDERYDYGAVKLNCNIGQTTGWYGLLAQSMTLNGQRSIITGYPGDKPLTQWRSI